MIPQTPLHSWQGRTVRSPRETEGSASQKVRDHLSTLGNRLHGSLFFVPSPLEGWGLETLVQALPPDSTVVCFEKDVVLDPWCRPLVEARLSSQASRVLWLENDTEDAVRALVQELPLFQLRRVEWLPLTGGWLLSAARYREVAARLDREVSTFWSNRLTMMHLGPLWIRNVFDNLVEHSVTAPWPHWGNEGVLVFGAGTSLEGWLPVVKRERDRWRIVAADTALPALMQSGVVPNAVVCLESQQVNLMDFLPAAGRSIDLFCDLSAHPATTRALNGRRYWFCTPFGDLTLWDRLKLSMEVVTLPPLGSVGVAAVAVAHRLTRGHVVLVGLDFSWPPGKSHARGSPAVSARLLGGNRLTGVEQTHSWSREGTVSVEGSDWLTSRVLQTYAGTLRDIAAPEQMRTSVLGSKGLELGLKRLFELTSEQKTRSEQLEVQVEGGHVRWLAQEVKLLAKLLASLDLINTSPESHVVWLELEGDLRNVDYLFFAFPDPQIRLDSSYLSRVLILARWMRTRLTQRISRGI